LFGKCSEIARQEIEFDSIANFDKSSSSSLVQNEFADECDLLSRVLVGASAELSILIFECINVQFKFPVR
jgi:hypothetical protein